MTNEPAAAATAVAARPDAAPAEKPADTADDGEPSNRRRTRAVAALLTVFALAIFGVAGWRAGAGDWIMVRRWTKRLADRNPAIRRETVERMTAFAWPDRPGPAEAAHEPPPAVRESSRYARVVAAVEPLLDAADPAAFEAAARLLDRLGAAGRPAAQRPDIRLRRLLADYHTLDAIGRTRVVQSLPSHFAARADQVAAALNAALADPTPAVRSEAAWVLLEWDSPAAGPLRRSLRYDPSADNRELAAVLAAAVADRQAGPMLAELALEPPVPDRTRGDVARRPSVNRRLPAQSALLALAAVDPEAGRSAAIRLLDSERPELRKSAIYLLGFIRSRESLAILERIADDVARPPAVRALALAGAARADPVRGGGRLGLRAGELLAGDDRDARGWAAFALTRTDPTAAAAALLRRIHPADRATVGGETAGLRMLGELKHAPAVDALAVIAGAAPGVDTPPEPRALRRSSPTALAALFAVDPARAARTAAELLARVPPRRSPTRPSAGMAELSEAPDDLAERAALWAAYCLAGSAEFRAGGLAPLLPAPASVSDRAAALEILAGIVSGEPAARRRVAERFPPHVRFVGVPEVDAVRMLLAGPPSFAAVEARVAEGEWDFLLGWITLRAAPQTRKLAWHLLLMGTDPNYRSAERPNPDSIDRRLQYYGLDRELAAEFPDMPRYEHYADREVRKFQCYVLMAWWWSKGVR